MTLNTAILLDMSYSLLDRRIVSIRKSHLVFLHGQEDEIQMSHIS